MTDIALRPGEANRGAGKQLWLAILSLCGGVLIFSLQDVIIKLLSGGYPVHEVVMIRCLSALPILLFMVHRQAGLAAIVTGPVKALVWRGMFLVVSYSAYYLAFPVMKLADIVALYFTVPIFVTALAGPFLGEKIGWQRWAATLVGFAGVVVMLRPGGSVFNLVALMPVVSAMGYGAAQLMARGLAARTPAIVMSFYQNLMFLLAAGIMALFFGRGVAHDANGVLDFLLRAWVTPSWRDLLLLAACGPISAIGMTLLSQAYRMAEANFVASFEYSGLIWATLWGFFIFGEVPDQTMILGAALIVGAGLYMLYGTGRRG
ncbi:MAG TPA: DMT family transporter [Dongiaceae bacterium]|nr:DMT family transporter [Dongiaceae bacterium]